MSEGLVGEKTSYRVVPVAHESELWQHCRDIRIEVIHTITALRLAVPSASSKRISKQENKAYMDHLSLGITKVFHHEQGYSLAEEIDDLDPECVHLLLLAHTSSSVKEEPAGVLRYFPPPKSKIGRVAVRKPFRGKGAGGALMKGLEALLSGDIDVETSEPPMNMVKARPKEMTLHAQGGRIPLFACNELDVTDNLGITSTRSAILSRSRLCGGR